MTEEKVVSITKNLLLKEKFTMFQFIITVLAMSLWVASLFHPVLLSLAGISGVSGLALALIKIKACRVSDGYYLFKNSKETDRFYELEDEDIFQANNKYYVNKELTKVSIVSNKRKCSKDVWSNLNSCVCSEEEHKNNRAHDCRKKSQTTKNVQENKEHFFIDESTGREKEMDALVMSLALLNKSAIIVGEPGVGKTALINGLEYRIQHGQVPEFLKNKSIVRKSAAELISNTKYVGEVEAKMLNIIDKIKGKNVILFIDEIHNVIGAGRSEHSTLDIANILKPYLSNGDIKLIGATTEEEYNKYILQDSAFSRRFEKIIVKEPDDKTLEKIINVQIENNEKKYNIKFGFSEIEKRAIIKVLIDITNSKHRNYKDYKYNPALVLSILEKAFAMALVNNQKTVTRENIISAINSNSDIYDSCKSDANKLLNNNVNNVEKTKVKSIDASHLFRNNYKDR